MFLIVSDLHLGDGGPLEDFLLWGPEPAGPPPGGRPTAMEMLDREFGALLDVEMRHARRSGWGPTLLLLGDTFDLWQARRRGECPGRALERILHAHPHWLAGLRAWIGGGGRVEIILGNHDQELLHPAAWGLLGEVLPGLNKSSAGQPAHFLRDEASGLYAEHGHQWDSFNRLRALHRWDARCAGREIVRRIVNPVEPHLPWIDKLQGFGDMIDAAAHALDRPARMALRSTLLSGARVSRWKRLAAALLALEGETRPEELDRARIGSMVRGMRRALSPRPGGTIGPLPANLRLFISGHTHQPLLARAGGGVLRLNPGSWVVAAHLTHPGQPRMSQDLTSIRIAPNDGGKWHAELVSRVAAAPSAVRPSR